MAELRKVRIDELAMRGPNSMATGPFGSSIGSRFFRRSGVPVIRGGNLSADPSIRLNDENLVFLEPGKAAEFSRSTVREGDLIFTSWGTINQVGLIDDSASYPEYVISNKQMKLTPDPEIASSKFLYFLFSSPAVQRQILEGSIGSSVPGFNLTRLRSLEFNIPLLGEQNRIVEILEDAEMQESVLRRLIMKKKEVKRVISRRLLTGVYRLPGFTTEWVSSSIGSRSIGLRGAGLNRSVLSPGGRYDCVLYGELFTKYGYRIERVVSRTDVDGGVRSEAGDVLIPGSTTTVARDLATASAIHVSGVVIGGDTNIIRPNSGLDPDWLAYYFTDILGDYVSEVAQGTTIKHLYVRDILGIDIPIPDIREQRAIVEVLLDVDRELSTLESLREKSRLIDSGLMQSLLGGCAV